MDIPQPEKNEPSKLKVAKKSIEVALGVQLKDAMLKCLD